MCGYQYEDEKPIIGYLCSYFPKKAIENLGFETIAFSEITSNTSHRKGDLPVNICSYVRYCQGILEYTKLDGIVLFNCCNAMQRLYDWVKSHRPDLFCHMVELPRNDSALNQSYLQKNIDILFKDICNYFQFIPPKEALSLENDIFVPHIEDDTIYVIGSAVSPILKDKIEEYTKPNKVYMNICSSRNIRAADGNFRIQEPCARMEWFTGWFDSFLAENRTKLKGIIYMPCQHCDSFLFSYPSVRRLCIKYNIPLLEIEEGYKHTGFGQISTRLEAFLESVDFKSKAVYRGNSEEISSGSRTADMDIKNNGLDGRNVFQQRMNLVRAIVQKLPMEAIKMVVNNQVELFTNKIWSTPEKIIWTNMVMPVEIFYSSGLIPVNMELVAGWTASLQLSKHFISKSEGVGFSSSLCSYHKATMGLILENCLPVPKGIAISSHICDGGPGIANYLRDIYKTESFILNVPFNTNQINFSYVKKQFEMLIDWVERYTGNKTDMEKLKESMRLTNQARDYWIKAFELRKGDPLFYGHLSLRNLFGATFLFGSQLGVDVARAYYQQLLQKSEDNNGHKSTKKRLLWIHFAPLYNNSIMEYLEKELDCWIVMDITGYIYWEEYDLEHPIDSLVKRSLSHFYLGNPMERKELYRRLAKKYTVDGIVHFMHNGCRAIPGAAWQVRELAAELDMPVLELTGDCIDPRGFSEEQMKLRMEAFKETLGRDLFVSGS